MLASSSALSRPLLGPVPTSRRHSSRSRQVVSPAASAADNGASAAAARSAPPPGSYAVQKLNSATRLEHMDSPALHTEPGGNMHRYHHLDQAESELNNFCSLLTPEEYQTEKCWQAYSFLESRREAAAASCDSEDSSQPCHELDHLNEMARELLSTGSMDDLVATFSTLARVEELRSARAAKQAEAAGAAAQQQAAGQADFIHDLFVRMDANKDGRLSVIEFQQGMSSLGPDLDRITVGLVLGAISVEGGSLTEQQFRDILEAESIVSQSMVAKMWRHPHSHRS